MITVQTTLNPIISHDSAPRTWSAHHDRPENLVEASRIAEARKAEMVDLYGDIGAGSTYIYINGNRVSERKAEPLRYAVGVALINHARSVLADMGISYTAD